MNNQFMCGAIHCGAITLFREATDYTGPERRDHRRYPRTIGITVQRLEPRETETAPPPFLALTREVSRSGLSFLSSQPPDSEMVAIQLQNDDTRLVVCRVVRYESFFGIATEKSYLVSVEFLYECQATR